MIIKMKVVFKEPCVIQGLCRNRGSTTLTINYPPEGAMALGEQSESKSRKTSNLPLKQLMGLS